MVPRLDRADWWRVVGIAAIGTVGFTVLLLLGLRVAPGAVASVVMATAPAVTAVGAVLFLHNRMDRWIALGIALTVAAVLAALMFIPTAAWQLRDFDWTAPTAGQWVAVLWWGAGTMGQGSVLWSAA